jgi:hypothetical protein
VSGRVDVRTEALTTIARGLGSFDARAAVVLRDFEAQARRAYETVAGELARRRSELAQARDDLARADEHTVARCRARVEAAEVAVRIAETALATVEGELARLRGAMRRYLGDVRQTVASGQAQLRALGANIELYAVGASGGGGAAQGGLRLGPDGSVGLGPTGGGGAPGGGGGLAAALAAHGLELVDVQLPDYSGNPKLTWSKGDATIADYRWAVETWDTQVAGMVARGLTHDDLVRLDQERGATGFRRLAGVWDLFLGSDPVVVEEDASGALGGVPSGRHRLEAARQLGVTHLPARVDRPRR